MTKRVPATQTKRPAAKRKSGGAGHMLTDEVRRHIVMRLAMFDQVKDIHAELLAQGFDISHQAVSKYNPSNVGYRSDKWAALFDQTRETFLKEIAAEPITSRAFRLRKLGKLLEAAINRGNSPEARALLEQAAKETGSVYTNISKVHGSASPTTVDTSSDLTADERRNMLADRIAEAVRKMPKQAASGTLKH